VTGESVKRCATKLLDKKLLVKVFSGSFAANESRYHSRCLVALYVAADRVKNSEGTASHVTEDCYTRAFAELIAFFEESVTSMNEHSSVF